MPTEVACFRYVFSLFLSGNIHANPSFSTFFFIAVYVCPRDDWRGPRHIILMSQISAFYDRVIAHVCYSCWSCNKSKGVFIEAEPMSRITAMKCL